MNIKAVLYVSLALTCAMFFAMGMAFQKSRPFIMGGYLVATDKYGAVTLENAESKKYTITMPRAETQISMPSAPISAGSKLITPDQCHRLRFAWDGKNWYSFPGFIGYVYDFPLPRTYIGKILTVDFCQDAPIHSVG